MLAGQSSTVISWSAKHLEVVLALWEGAKVLLEKEISISIKLVSRWKHRVLENLLVDGCIDFGLDKTKWTNTSRRHGTPNHPWLQKLHTGLQAAWILCLSTLPPDFDFQMKAKFTFIWKEDFGTLSNSPVLCLHSPGKMLLTMFLFQKWLGSPFPEDVWAWWLLMHWLQLQFTPCEALPSVWISFAWLYSQACGHPCCLCTFSYPNSSFQSTLHLICFDIALLEQPPLSVMTLCDLPSLWRVSMFIFWIIAKSAVFPICGFKEQEIPRIYTVWMDIYWNSNVNILIFWDTDFWLSWAVSSNHQIKTKKLLKCFTLHVMNLKYMKVPPFEISYKKKMNFFTIF